ncbi:hypothetical protein C922_02406 [Plasmodium inui San Antonio 1]|uniref:Uncharacterized protein n=1 Tax=Plasmodium inui San Antonio 1 TaxID=1237626 RepID=W7APE1_9APIC|nr:hypothetical protein C922_02406 [Plasmodium inui San Antonio 1]EUD67256.1 hypothetical protein C922_02406 [Plasmodium inui San Antonio 1]
MNTVKCYGRLLPASRLDNDRHEEKKFLKSELILTKMYGEKMSNLKIYNDILKKRIKKLTDGVSNLFIVLNNEEKDGTMLTVGDGNTSSGILFYLINDLVHGNRSNCKLLITFSHFEIVRNRVKDKLKRYVLPQRNMIDIGNCLGCETGNYDWIRSRRRAHKDGSPSSGYPLEAERNQYVQKKERYHGGNLEKRETNDPCGMCTEWEDNRLVNSDVLFDVDSFVKGNKSEKYGRRHTKRRSTGEWDPTAVRKVYLTGKNIRHIFKMLCRSGRGKSVGGFCNEVTYEVVEFHAETAQGRGPDVLGVRSYSDGGIDSGVSNKSSICRNSPVSTCSVTIMVVNNLKRADSSERAFLSHFCELFLKRREDANRRRAPNVTCEKGHSLIIKYLFSLYKLPPLRRSVTGVNSLPFELNFIYISTNFKKYRTASEFIYAYLKRLNRSECFVQSNEKLEYLKSGFHKVDENIYVVKSLLNYYAKLERRGGEINRRIANLRNYLTILESSVILGAKRRSHDAWTENRINNVLNICRSSTFESGEQIEVETDNSCCLEKENFFFSDKEWRIRRHYREAERERQHGGKYEDSETSPRSTQMKENAKGEDNHLRSVKNVREIKKGKHNPDNIHFKLSLYKRGRTNLVGNGDHSRMETDYSSGNANLGKCKQHCYKHVRGKKNNMLQNSCTKKEQTILVDSNSYRKCIHVKYQSSGTYTHCANDDPSKCRVKLFLRNDEDLLHSRQVDELNHGLFTRPRTPMQNFVPTNGMNPKKIHSSCMDPFSNTMEVDNLCDRPIVSHKGKEKKFLPCDILGMPYSNGSASSCEENEKQLESVLHNMEQNRDFLKSISTLNSDIKKGRKKIDNRARSLFEQVDQCLREDTRGGEGRPGLEKQRWKKQVKRQEKRQEKRNDLGQYRELERRDHPNATIEVVQKNGEPQTGRQAGKQKKTKKDDTCVEMQVKRGFRKLALQEFAKWKLTSGKNNLSCSRKGNKSGKSGNSIDGHKKVEKSNNSLTLPMSAGKETNKFDNSDETFSKADPISDPLDTLIHQSSLDTEEVDIKSKCDKFPAEGLSSKHIFDKTTSTTNKLPDKGKEKKTRNCVEHPVHLNGCKMDKKSLERIFSPTKRRDSNLASDANELNALHSNNHWLGQNGGSIKKQINMEENRRKIEEDLLFEERANCNGEHISMCPGEWQCGGASRMAATGALTHVSYRKGDDRGRNTIKQAQEEEEIHVRSSNENVFSFSSKNKNEMSKGNHYCSSQAIDDDIVSGCTLDGETIMAASPNGINKDTIKGSNRMAKMRKKRQNYSWDCADNENVTVASSGSPSTGQLRNVSDSCEEELDQSIENYHNNFKKLLKSHMNFLQKKCVNDNNDLELLKKIKFAKGVLREYNRVLGRSPNGKHEQSVLMRQIISNGWGVEETMFEQHCGRSPTDKYSECVDMGKNYKDGFLRKKNKTTDSEVVRKGMHPGRDARSANGNHEENADGNDVGSADGRDAGSVDRIHEGNEQESANGVEHTERCSVQTSTSPHHTARSVYVDKNSLPACKPKENNYGNSDHEDNFDEAEIENSYTREGEYFQWEKPPLLVSTETQENISSENGRNVNASAQYDEENVPRDDPPHGGNVITCDPNDIYNEYEEEPFGEEERSALPVDNLDELQNGRGASSQGNYPSKSGSWENPPPGNEDNEGKRNSESGEADRIGHVMDEDMHKSDNLGNSHRGKLFAQRSFSSMWDEVEDVVAEDSFMKVESNPSEDTCEKTTLHSHAVIRKIRRKKKVLRSAIQDEENKLTRHSSKKKKLMSFILRAIERGEKDEQLLAIVRSAIFKVEYFEQKKISKLKRMEKEFEKLTHVEEKMVSNFLMRKSQFSGKKNKGGELRNRTVGRKNGHEGKDDNEVYQRCGSHLDERKNKDAHSHEEKRNNKNVENHFQKKSQKDHQTRDVHPLRGGEKKEKKNNCAHLDAFQEGRVCNNFFNLNDYNKESKKSIAFSDLYVNLKKEKHSTSPVDAEQPMRVVPSLRVAKLGQEALIEKSPSERIPPSGYLHPKKEQDTPRDHHNGGGRGTGGGKGRTCFTLEEAKKCDAPFQNCGDTADGWPKLSGNRLDGCQQHIGYFPLFNDNSAREDFPQWDRDFSKETDKNRDINRDKNRDIDGDINRDKNSTRNITVAYRDISEVRGSSPRSSHTFKQKIKGKRTKLGLSYDRSLEGQNIVPRKRNPAKECTTKEAENLRLNSFCFSNGGRSKREAILPSTEGGDKSTRRFQVGVKVPLTGESVPTGERHRSGQNIPDKGGKKKGKNIHREEEKKENKGGKEHSAWGVDLGDARTERRPRSNQIEKNNILGNSKDFHVSVRMDPPRGNGLQRKGSFRRRDVNRGFFPLENPPSSYTSFCYAPREAGYPEMIPHSSTLNHQCVVSRNWDETKRIAGSPLARCQAERCEEEEAEAEQIRRNRHQRNFINVKHKSTPETKGDKNVEQISVKTVINRQREKTIPCINYDTNRYSFKLGWWNWGKKSKILENIGRCKENIKEKYYQNRRECKHRSSTNWTSKYFTKFQPNEYLYIPVTNKNYFRSKNSLKIRSNPVSDFHKVNLKPITGFLQSYEKERQRQKQVPRAVIRVSTVPYVVEDYNVKRGLPKMGGKTGVSLGESNILLSEDEESNLNNTSGFFAKVSKKNVPGGCFPSGYYPNGRRSYSRGTNSNDEKNSKGIIFKCRTKQAHKMGIRESNSGAAHGRRNSKARLYNTGNDINEETTHTRRHGKAHSGGEGSNEKDELGQRWDPQKKTTVKVRRYRIPSIESLPSVRSAPGRPPQECSLSMVRLSSGSTASGSAGSSKVVSPTNAKYKVNLKSKKREDYPQGEDPRHTPSSQCSNKSEVPNSSRRSGSSCYSTSSVGIPNAAFQEDAKGELLMYAAQRKKFTNYDENDEENLSRRSYKHMNISSKREYPGYTTNQDTHFNMYREGYKSMQSELGRNRHIIECDGSKSRDSSAASIAKASGEGPYRGHHCPNEINQLDYLQPDSCHREKRENRKKHSCKNAHHNSYPRRNDGYYEGQHRDRVNPETHGRKGHDADYLEKQYDEYFYDN